MKKLLLLTAGIVLMANTHSNAQSNSNHNAGNAMLLQHIAGFGSNWVSYVPGAATTVPPGHPATGNYFGNLASAHNANNFKTFDGGGDGTGINVQLNRRMSLNLDLGYNQGATDALKDPGDTYNTDHDFDLNVGLYVDLNK